MPKVSIIIATYKRPKYLEETLKSVLSQTFNDFEVIVIDDGTPGTENEQICLHFSNVTYKKINNTGGPITPRNEGIKIAKGKYIAFLDDDDLWMPEKLERQVNILDSNPDFGLVHCFCKVIDQNGDETGEIIGRLHEPMRKHGYVFDDMVGNFTIMMVTPLIRRSIIDEVGGFNANMMAAGEDAEFFIRLAFFTKFYFVDEPLALYRIHGENISQLNLGYAHMTLALFNVIASLRKRNLLSKQRFNKLRKRLLLKYAEHIYNRESAKIVFYNSFKIHPLFWMMPKVIIPLIKKTAKCN